MKIIAIVPDPRDSDSHYSGALVELSALELGMIVGDKASHNLWESLNIGIPRVGKVYNLHARWKRAVELDQAQTKLNQISTQLKALGTMCDAIDTVIPTPLP